MSVPGPVRTPKRRLVAASGNVSASRHGAHQSAPSQGTRGNVTSGNRGGGVHAQKVPTRPVVVPAHAAAQPIPFVPQPAPVQQPRVVQQQEIEEAQVADGEEPITEKEYVVRVPDGMTAEETHAALDKVLYASSAVKRPYNSSRLDAEFGDGGEFCNAIISLSRLYFCRYLQIHDDQIVVIINKSSANKVEAQVDDLQMKIESENAWISALEGKYLCDAYAAYYSFENFFRLMGTTRAVVDWKTTLEQPKAGPLYKTIFTYSLVYSHMGRHDPLKFNRTNCMDKIRLIGIRPQYNDIGLDIVILLPSKPPSKVRFRKTKDKDLLTNDEAFIPFSDDEGEDNAEEGSDDATNAAVIAANQADEPYRADENEIAEAQESQEVEEEEEEEYDNGFVDPL
ncbi:uncharacterized protein H6S33_007170 [Morchella sextelata]|uniref:uncharacterized protein n=1 Tax=Morchella sextelata TaxID=1174677 RepID=UPI001D04C277|nr:uncharacterized protein H6S33_007170 [Morchella sextelata]KAH0604139.1 hypothetical protein H6S33_007170 [Morchella sextelata]